MGLPAAEFYEFAAAAHANWHVIHEELIDGCLECVKFDKALEDAGVDKTMKGLFEAMGVPPST